MNVFSVSVAVLAGAAAIASASFVIYFTTPDPMAANAARVEHQWSRNQADMKAWASSMDPGMPIVGSRH